MMPRATGFRKRAPRTSLLGTRSSGRRLDHPHRREAQPFHLGVERAPADSENTRGSAAVPARFAQGLGDPPGLGEVHPVSQRYGPPPIAFARLSLEVAEL